MKRRSPATVYPDDVDILEVRRTWWERTLHLLTTTDTIDPLPPSPHPSEQQVLPVRRNQKKHEASSPPPTKQASAPLDENEDVEDDANIAESNVTCLNVAALEGDSETLRKYMNPITLVFRHERTEEHYYRTMLLPNRVVYLRLLSFIQLLLFTCVLPGAMVTRKAYFNHMRMGSIYVVFGLSIVSFVFLMFTTIWRGGHLYIRIALYSRAARLFLHAVEIFSVTVLATWDFFFAGSASSIVGPISVVPIIYFCVCSGFAATYLQGVVGLTGISVLCTCKLVLIALHHGAHGAIIYAAPIVLVFILAGGFAVTGDKKRRIAYIKYRVVENRLSQMRLEQMKTNYLLSLSLPGRIVDKLREVGTDNFDLIAERIAKATVMFVDVRNFKQIASSIGSTKDALTLLNGIFEYLDECVEQYPMITKIKTISTKILFVGGLDGSDGHVKQMLDMALSMQEYFDTAQPFCVEDRCVRMKLEVSFGVDVGPLVAGIVGRKKFVYEIYGDVVNSASRMCAQASAGQIVATENVHNEVGQAYSITSMGTRFIKGKGVIPIFSVDGTAFGGSTSDIPRRDRSGRQAQLVKRFGSTVRLDANLMPSSYPVRSRSHMSDTDNSTSGNLPSLWGGSDSGGSSANYIGKGSRAAHGNGTLERGILNRYPSLLSVGHGLGGTLDRKTPASEAINVATMGSPLTLKAKATVPSHVDREWTAPNVTTKSLDPGGRRGTEKVDKISYKDINKSRHTPLPAFTDLETKEALVDVVERMCSMVFSGDSTKLGQRPLKIVSNQISLMTLFFRNSVIEKQFRSDMWTATYKSYLRAGLRGLFCEVLLYGVALHNAEWYGSNVLDDMSTFTLLLVSGSLSIGVQLLISGVLLFSASAGGDIPTFHAFWGTVRYLIVFVAFAILAITVTLPWSYLYLYDFLCAFVVPQLTFFFMMRNEGMIFVYRSLSAAIIGATMVLVQFSLDQTTWPDGLSHFLCSFLWIMVFRLMEKNRRLEYLLDHILETQSELVAKEINKNADVLHSILPQTVIMKLLQDPTSIVYEEFKMVTILHMDIAGFTAMSSELEPLDIVKVLNTLFTYFDYLTEEYNIEKITTIGDAYVACSSLSNSKTLDSELAALSVCLVALQMQAYVEHHLNTSPIIMNGIKKPLKMRIGVHTGPASGAIMGGPKNFRYDVIGETVILAEKMQERCPVDSVCITESTYACVKDYHGFRFSPIPKSADLPMPGYLLDASDGRLLQNTHTSTPPMSRTNTGPGDFHRTNTGLSIARMSNGNALREPAPGTGKAMRTGKVADMSKGAGTNRKNSLWLEEMFTRLCEFDATITVNPPPRKYSWYNGGFAWSRPVNGILLSITRHKHLLIADKPPRFAEYMESDDIRIHTALLVSLAAGQFRTRRRLQRRIAMEQYLDIVRALHDYASTDESCLSFNQGDRLFVYAKDKSGWWDGVTESGLRGWFPSNYVEPVPKDELPTGRRPSTSLEVPRPLEATRKASSSTVATNGSSSRVHLEATLSALMEEAKQLQMETEASPVVGEPPSASLESLAKELTEGTNMNPVQSGQSSKGTSKQNGELPPFWGCKTTPQGQVYYYNTQTNQTTYSLAEVEKAEKTTKRSTLVLMDAAKGITPSGLKRNDGSAYASAASLGDSRNPHTSMTSINSNASTVVSLSMVPPRKESMDGASSASSSSKPRTISQMSANLPIPYSLIPPNSTPTWEILINNILHAISALNNAAKHDSKTQYVGLANTVVLSIRDMLASSGTTSKDAPHIRENKLLRSHHHHIMSSLSKLVLASKVAAGLWPPPDAVNRMRYQAGQVLLSIRHFVAIAQDIPLDLTPIPSPAETNANDFDMNGAELSDIEFVSRLDMHSDAIIASIARLVNMITAERRISGSLIEQARLTVTEIGMLLSLIEEIPISDDALRSAGTSQSGGSNRSSGQRPASDAARDSMVTFATKKETLYSTVNDLVTAARTTMDEFAPPNALGTLLETTTSVLQAVEDVLMATKLLIDQREISELRYMASVAEEYDEERRRDSELGVLQRRAMSLTFLGEEQPPEGPRERAASSPMMLRTDPEVHRGPQPAIVTGWNSGQRRPSIAESVSSVGSMGSREGMPGMARSGSAHNVSLTSAGSVSPRRVPQRSGPPSAKLNKFFGEDAPKLRTSGASEKAWFLDYEYSKGEILINMEGGVSGGTLEALIERLTVHDAPVDPTFFTAFLMLFHQFTTSTTLFTHLRQRYFISPPSGLTAEEYKMWQEKKQTPIRLRVYNALRAWLEHWWIEDEDDVVLDAIWEFARTEMVDTGLAGRLVELVQRKVDGVVQGMQHSRQSSAAKEGGGTPKAPRRTLSSSTNGSEISLQTISTGTSISAQSDVGYTPNSAPPAPIMPKNIKRMTLMDIDPLEMARQLTIMESKVFCQIKPMELINQTWTTKPHLAPNVGALTKSGNDIATLVISSILAPPDPKHRANVIKYFIKVSQHLHQLNNFNSLMAVLSGLNSAGVARLKRTWEGVSGKWRTAFEALRKIVGVEKNFRELRESVRRVGGCCLPFLGVYLTDLTFTSDGNPAFRTSSNPALPPLINMDKYIKLARLILEIQRFQVAYPLTVVAEIQDWVTSRIAEWHGKDAAEELYRFSLEREPRVDEVEQERLEVEAKIKMLQRAGFL
ncbi:hypothetical protein HDU85_000923 [Gaertneriomyces sp. JEL0708]|nr:hypothetical protein HDU85_000923 [Gaertneriomyces sp. JEL0708]